MDCREKILHFSCDSNMKKKNIFLQPHHHWPWETVQDQYLFFIGADDNLLEGIAAKKRRGRLFGHINYSRILNPMQCCQMGLVNR